MVKNYAVEGRQMLTGAQYAELAAEMMMNRVPWDVKRLRLGS